ncbi:hypothetical protein CU103_29175 [Phyllobacterium sophorae]|uniref:HTH deoR-type domain-containing protein n=2 Tax=Phyllobacterium sophorae TaxID=1520277 RepID=A0A2P7AQK2_9HYPH|nr:hypothetical protein CU103_29175 [Phyllobacterium sophorae]
MLGTARRQHILKRLESGGQVELSILVDELGCSPETLRRDLRALEQTGKLRRVHGGAVGVSAGELPPLEARKDKDRQAKALIAGLARDVVTPGSMIYIGGGSTALAVAAEIADMARSTFVTGTTDVAAALASQGKHEVHLAGGLYDAPTRSVIGPEMLDFLRPRVFDLSIIGISGIELDHGFMGPTSSHVTQTSVIRKQSRRVMVVCDVTKFGIPGRYKILDFDQVDLVVTNELPEPAFVKRLSKAGTEVISPRSIESGR